MVEKQEEEGDFVCKEGPVIMPDQSVLEQSHQKKWKHTLIGKLHITELKSVKSYHVIRDINRSWTIDNKIISRFTVVDLGDGMFSFHFQDKKDMKWVLDSRPWLVTEDHYNINQYLVLFTKWCPNTPPSKIMFSPVHPFWVQVVDVPYEYVSREMGKKIGEGTGHQVLDVDFEGTNSWNLKCLRIRVMVDVTKKLATGCWLVISKKNQPNKVLWVPFKYERLPKFCYKCGVIGHCKDRCLNDLSDSDGDEEDVANFDPDGVGHESELPEVLVEGKVLRVEGKKGYGPWLYGEMDSNEEEDEEDEDYNDDEEEESESNDEDYEGLVDEWDDTDQSDESDEEEMEAEEDEVVKEVTSEVDRLKLSYV